MIRGFLIVLCAAVCLAEKVRYDGYQVLRVTPKTENELNTLKNLESSLLGEQLSFWREPTYVDRPVDIMVSPTLREDVVRLLGRRGIRLSTMVEDVQKDTDEVEANLRPQADFDYNNYNDIDTIEQWVADFAAANSVVTAGSMGSSYEGRQLNYVKISSGGSGKKAVVFHGGIHAREWVTPATVMYMAKYLADGSADATRLLSYFDFYIVPVMNPDGYAYTWTNDRMWRKTRKPNGGSFCVGTDPNRNFATGWGDQASGGSSDYMYEGQGVQYAYALEGRDTGRYGFQLPARQIQPSAEENWAALVAVCDYVYANLS
ncbi:carboxypeptidase A2-like [Amphiura filiformis]|uniref:carboxypeptidase A2-like n=1 Tax=Amphiura filiformis TaxID=82378 RepID=UPI003B227872